MGKHMKETPRTKPRNCLAVKWKDITVFLPTVTISADLKSRADKELRLNQAKEQTQEVTDDWDPSWDDNDDEYRAIVSKNDDAQSNFKDSDKRCVGQAEEKKIREKRASVEKSIKASISETKTSVSDKLDGQVNKCESNSTLNSLNQRFNKRKELFKNLLEGSTALKKCDKCSKQYSDADSHQCTESCKQSINNQYSHLRKLAVKSNSTDLKCKECGKTFNKRIHLTLHQKIHASMDKPVVKPANKVFHCNYCESKFERNDDLLSHYQRKHSISNNFHVHQLNSGNKTSIPSEFNQDDKFECKYCDERFSTAHQFYYHAELCKTKSQQRTSSTSKTYKTFTEPKTETINIYDLENLIGITSTFNHGTSLPDRIKRNPRLCNVNNASATSENTTVKQRDEDSENSDVDRNLKPYNCPHCDRKFKHMHFLNFHQRTHYQLCSNCKLRVLREEYQQHCESCAKSSTALNLLPAPSFTVESIRGESGNDLQDEKATCETCNKAFESKFLLNQHNLIHSFSTETIVNLDSDHFFTSLPFSCLDIKCQSRFSHLEDQQLHILQNHATQDIGRCEVCLKSFSSVFNLFRHRSSAHNLERPKRFLGNELENQNHEECSPSFIPQPTYFYIQRGHLHKKPPTPHVLLSDDLKKAADDILEELMSRSSLQSFNADNEAELPRNRGKGKIRHDVPFRDVYTCKRCHKKFSIRQQYLVHLSQHKRLDRYRCNLCSKAFLSENQLRVHVKRHDDPTYLNSNNRGSRRTDIPIQKEYICERCDTNFKNRRLFLIHIWTHNKEDEHKCEICDRGFLSDKLLQEHKKRHDDPSYVPGAPGRGFIRRTDIPIQRIYTCDTCNTTFTQSQRGLYLIHIRQHNFDCHMCKKSLQNKSWYDQHMERHKDPNYAPENRRFRDDIPYQSVYTCESCDKKFSQRRLYLIHLNQHKMWEKYTCQICDRKYLSEAAFNDHIQRHSDPSYVPGQRGKRRTDIPEQDSYTCNTCNKVFEQRKEYLVHLSQHERESRYPCTLCDRKFLNNLMLQLHLKRHEDPTYVPGQRGRGRVRTDIPEQDSYSCEACDKVFDQRRLYLMHLSLHEREKKYTCSTCGRKFPSNILYQLHLKRHDDPSYVPMDRGKGRVRTDIPFQDSYTCETCSKVFDQRRLYIIHLSLHKREKKYSCSLCHMKFGSNQLFQAHLKRHEDPTYVPRKRIVVPFQDIYHCEYCEKEYFDRKSFILHVNFHLREPKHGCHLCERKFYSAKLLHDHLRKHLDPSHIFRSRTKFRKRQTNIPIQDEYTCEKCDRKYTNRHNFLVHLYSHNLKEQRSDGLRCNLCDRDFINKSRFNNHMRLHSGTDEINRNGRKRTDIPFQSVYHCDCCEEKKSFTSRQKFLVHIRYHSLKAKFACPQCPRSFKTKPMLEEHVDTHNSRKIYECKDCLKMFRTKFVRYFHQQKFCKKIPCKFQCNLCDDRFHDQTLLQKHFQRIHAETDEHGDTKQGTIKPEHEFSCPYCGHTFANVFYLHRHFAVYHPSTVDATETETSLLNFINRDNKNTNKSEPNDDDHNNPLSSDSTEEGAEQIPEISYQDDGDDNDDDAFDMSDMLATDFLETEMVDEETTNTKEHGSLPDPLKRQKEIRLSKDTYSRSVCFCKTKLKYKSQTFCHNKTCPCVRANRRCDLKCRCTENCLNNKNCEDDQQQMFKEGRETMFLEEQQQLESETPLEDKSDNSNDSDEPPLPCIIGQPVSLRESELSACKPTSSGYPSFTTRIHLPSEFISVDSGEQEEPIQDISGFIDESDDVDPLAESDPLEAQASTSSSTARKYPILKSQLGIPTPTNVRDSSNVPTANSVSGPSAESSTKIQTTGNKKLLKPLLTDFTSNPEDLICQFCKKIFKTIPSFICHFFVHGTEPAPYNCPILKCNETYTYISDFLQHLNGHNKGFTVQCANCSSKFRTIKDMDKHIKVHHFKQLECGLCSSSFPNAQLWMTHWSKEHPTCQCGLCMVKFFSYDDLTFHMKSFHSLYDCIHCGKRFETLHPLIYHFLETHYVELSKQRSLANRVFPRTSSSSNSNSTRHVLQNSKKSQHPKSFKCNLCGVLFGNEENLNCHLVSHLTQQSLQDTNNLSCGQGKTCTNVEELSIHLTNHILNSNPSANNAGDDHNSFTNVRYNDLELNRKRMIEKLIPENDNLNAQEVFSCPKCSKVCNSKSGLRFHIRTHGNVQFCSACVTVFETRDELIQHLNPIFNDCCVIHECDICFKNYNTTKALMQHVKKVHTLENRFPPPSSSADIINFQEESFPVIVASTSLAPQQSQQNRSTDDKNSQSVVISNKKNSTIIEEIVLD